MAESKPVRSLVSCRSGEDGFAGHRAVDRERFAEPIPGRSLLGQEAGDFQPGTGDLSLEDVHAARSGGESIRIRRTDHDSIPDECEGGAELRERLAEGCGQPGRLQEGSIHLAFEDIGRARVRSLRRVTGRVDNETSSFERDVRAEPFEGRRRLREQLPTTDPGVPQALELVDRCRVHCLLVVQARADGRPARVHRDRAPELRLEDRIVRREPGVFRGELGSAGGGEQRDGNGTSEHGGSSGQGGCTLPGSPRGNGHSHAA